MLSLRSTKNGNLYSTKSSSQAILENTSAESLLAVILRSIVAIVHKKILWDDTKSYRPSIINSMKIIGYWYKE